MEKKDSRKFKVIEVTVTHHYLIEMYDEERSHINGWTLDQVIDEWFKKFPIDDYHAARDGNKIFGSSKFISSRIIDPEKEDF